MHAGTAASPQQSSHVRQHTAQNRLPWDNTKARTEGRQTASSGDPGRGAEATEIFTQACFVAFVPSRLQGGGRGSEALSALLLAATQTS